VPRMPATRFTPPMTATAPPSLFRSLVQLRPLPRLTAPGQGRILSPRTFTDLHRLDRQIERDAMDRALPPHYYVSSPTPGWASPTPRRFQRRVELPRRPSGVLRAFRIDRGELSG
jgi:hypothetical protein